MSTASASGRRCETPSPAVLDKAATDKAATGGAATGGAAPQEAPFDETTGEVGAGESAIVGEGADDPAALGPERVLRGPGFGFVLDAAGLAGLACAPSTLAGPALKRLGREAQRVLGVDAEIAIALSTSPLACSSIYYVPLANDVRGIGYRHGRSDELFDETPNQRLEGVAFLNDFPYWHTHPAELTSAFAHEVAHRWGARVHASVPGAPANALLGRDQEHWSYYFSTGGSPLEGNVWLEAAPGFTSATPADPDLFSPLDLYLMGVLPADAVPAQRLLLEANGGAMDCLGRTANASSPPQTCGTARLDAGVVDVSIEDIIALEGARVPAPTREPREVSVVVLMLDSGADAWGAGACEAAASALRARVDSFERASGGRMRLRDTLGMGETCEALAKASALTHARAVGPAQHSASGCALQPASDPWIWGSSGWAFVALVGTVRRRRRLR